MTGRPLRDEPRLLIYEQIVAERLFDPFAPPRHVLHGHDTPTTELPAMGEDTSTACCGEDRTDPDSWDDPDIADAWEDPEEVEPAAGDDA